MHIPKAFHPFEYFKLKNLIDKPEYTQTHDLSETETEAGFFEIVCRQISFSGGPFTRWMQISIAEIFHHLQKRCIRMSRKSAKNHLQKILHYFSVFCTLISSDGRILQLV